MTLDLIRPEHRKALRWACQTWIAVHPGTVSVWPTLWHHAAMLAIIRPEQSAAIVRALLEGCGVPCVSVKPSPGDLEVRWGNTGVAFHVIATPRVPALIVALLDAADRDGAIAALNEHGR